MNIKKLLTVDDLRTATRRRVPKLAFDYLDGGAGSEANICRNRSQFEKLILVPEYLRDVSQRSQKIKLFDRTYDAPIGVSPVGLANLVWPKTDRFLARMARDRNIPYITSSTASTTIEEITAIAPEHTWFQVYVSGQEKISFNLLQRARQSGIDVLVVTVDIPVPSKRLRDLRNDFALPFRKTPKILWDVAKRPAWALATLRYGQPKFANMAAYLKDATTSMFLKDRQAMQLSAKLGEDTLKRIRDAWNGPMVIKGILSERSAEAAKRIGADGIIVSNHGGRQFDSAPASIEALPNLVKSVGQDLTVMMDSGIRNGIDVVKAIASGAKFTFSGRSFVFGIGALGEPGADHALDILVDEIDTALAQIGCANIEELGSDYLWENHK